MGVGGWLVVDGGLVTYGRIPRGWLFFGWLFGGLQSGAALGEVPVSVFLSFWVCSKERRCMVTRVGQTVFCLFVFF